MKYIIILILNINLFAQEIDVTDALKKIEAGEISSAISMLNNYKNVDPNDPSVIFLDAILTQNGEEALSKYLLVYDKYPKSKFADASLYRIFSYYFSVGLYKKAESYLSKLKEEYPTSPYIKAADRNIPEEEIKEIFNEKEKYFFSIQAGAFLNVENAKRLKDELSRNGYESEISTKEIGGSILNIVTVGKFYKEEDTRQLLDHLEKKYNLKGRIIEITK